MPDASVAVSVEAVSKSFRIATDPVNSLKERVLRLHRPGHVEFEALHDISCEIDEGETVGILGHNGSGKSTLLKCIAGILTPTSGQVRVRGRLASLLELGAGFHPELSGRENVYINAAFYGMARRETDRRFDEIVAFAELQQFIDEPVKHYSSGMYVRLGFAVAVNLEPDVLLVDEVLAVGDELFQAKCLSRIRQFQTEGRTIVFVTHDAATVRQVCDRAIVLDHGRLVLDGTPGDAIRTFREHLHGTLADVPDVAHRIDGAGVIGHVEIHHAHLATRQHLLPGEPLDIVVDVVAGAADRRPGAARRDRRPRRPPPVRRRQRRPRAAIVGDQRTAATAHRHQGGVAARRRVPRVAPPRRPPHRQRHRLARVGRHVRGRQRGSRRGDRRPRRHVMRER